MLFFIIAFFLFFYVYIKRMIRDSFSKKVILSFDYMVYIFGYIYFQSLWTLSGI